MTEQRSAEWFAQRLGKVTASRVKDVLATIKIGEAAARRDYRASLVVERLTGQCGDDPYLNGDMQRGIDLEPEACKLYEAQTGMIVEPCGFLDHPRIPMCGASPDGVVDLMTSRLGIEIKCPRAAKHIIYLKDGRVPPEYVPQMALQAACGDFAAVEFVSYCPQMPERLRLFVARWQRDEAYIESMEAAIMAFLVEVGRDEAELRRLAA